MRDTEEVYKFYRYSIMGNDIYCREYAQGFNYNVYSYDIKSSYPYEMLSKKYPIGQAKIIKGDCGQAFSAIHNSGKLYIIHGKMSNVRLRDGGFPIISPKRGHSKFSVKDFQMSEENGRLRFLDEYEFCLNCIDFAIVSKNYTFENLRIYQILYYEEQKELPQALIQELTNLFLEKEACRGDRKRYESAKRKINSVAGLFNRDPIKYCGSLEQYYKYNNNHAYYTNFPYQIGYWTLAYARRSLHQLVEAGTVYIDTDCVKTTTDLSEKVKKLNEERKLPNINAGQWVNEYNGPVLFRTFGPKQYFIRTPDGKEKIVLAGANKDTVYPYLKDTYGDIFSIDYAEIPEEYSGRVVVDIGDDYKVKAGSTYTIGATIDEETLLKLLQTFERK